MEQSEGKKLPKETWRYYHRKDKDSPIETAKGNANVIFSSTPDTHKMGLGAEIADLSGSNFIQSKVDFHTREMVRRWDAFEPDGLVGEMRDACELFMKTWKKAGPQGSHQFEKFDIVVHKMVAVLARAKE